MQNCRHLQYKPVNAVFDGFLYKALKIKSRVGGGVLGRVNCVKERN